jgi:Mor family transcriptional regulator
MTEDRTEDFLMSLLEIIDNTVGGIDESQSRQIVTRIAQTYGGERVYIRSPKTVHKWYRDDDLVRFVRAGNSVAQAAKKFGISRNWAYRTPKLRKRSL